MKMRGPWIDEKMIIVNKRPGMIGELKMIDDL